LFAAVVLPMAASGISNTWFRYVDQRAILGALLRSEATSAADKIESFLNAITIPLGSTFPENASSMASAKQLRLLALRTMHQIQGILSISFVDGTGTERLHVSRTGSNRTEAEPTAQAIPRSWAQGLGRSGIVRLPMAVGLNRS
jgi:hypothetical protein